jgi:V/A-type H+-transporting ATPase subunit B
LTARALQAAELAEIVGIDALPGADQRLLAFRATLEREFLSQGQREARTLDETLDLGWRVVSRLPAAELTMVSRQTLSERYRPQDPDGEHGHLG